MGQAENDWMTAEEGAGRLVWAIEGLAGAIGVEIDPVGIRRLARTSLEGRSGVEAGHLHEVLKQALEHSRLVPADAPPPAECLETTELPLVTVTGGVLVLSRQGGRFEVGRVGAAPEWLDAEETRRLVEQTPGPWLTATPATPLEALAHHPTPYERTRALMHLERDDLWVVVIYAVAVGLFTLATPVAVQSLVSSVAFGTLLQPIVVLSLLLLAALGSQAVLTALQGRVVESLQQRVFVRTALDLAWRLPRVKPEAAEAGFGPESVNRFFEVVTLQKTGSVLLTDGIAALLQIAIGLLVLAFYHPALLVFDLVLVVLVFLLVWAPSKRGLATAIDESYAKYEVAAWLEQLARPGSVFRARAGAAFAAERVDALTRRYLNARGAHFRVLFGQTIGALGLQVLASAALLGLGGWLVVQRELTLGQLIAAELIVAAVTSSVAKLGKLLDSAYDLGTAVEKLGHLLDLEIEDPDRSESVPGQGAVRVEVLSATDGAGAPPLSFAVKAGDRVSIGGAHGHRLAEWLAGLRLPARGTVSFNGVETSRARGPALREHIAWVQRGDLFEGTVLENVTAGRETITALEARAALERVGLLDELRALPEGIDTHLFHNGTPLSPSQLTRLLVARAIASTPRLIVVDEPLEGLPRDHRARCVQALARDNTPWTLVALVDDPRCALARACNTHLTLDELTERTTS
jgi:ABC-type bacteriocin/lantibiotic exporter with double-glycine peptidase domain